MHLLDDLIFGYVRAERAQNTLKQPVDICHRMKISATPKTGDKSDFDLGLDYLSVTFKRSNPFQPGFFIKRVANHGYYDHYCFLPLYVFCGNKLLVAYLRPGDSDNAKHAWAILALLVKRLRQVWPDVHIVFRGDSGFCPHQMLNWCDRHNVSYIAGMAKNSRLNDLAEPWTLEAAVGFLCSQEKQRLLGDFFYAANTWKYKRRVIVKAEHSALGENPRYVVTNLSGDPQQLYEKIYCARGEQENRIKEQQLCLFANRTSCMNWLPNQLRLLLSSVAYTLLEALRSSALKCKKSSI